MTILRRLVSRLSRKTRLDPILFEESCIFDGHAFRVVEHVETNAGRTYGPFLVCDDCDDITPLQVTPPAGHPDSMTVELGDAAEEYLAELDALLDPEAAM